ncbi:hypothetical protein XI02_14595 [Bradyrhizobium sp. CCBAU 21365]|nr:hypothetical protein XI02_14595 [Bradyrhizobium sp. CCBAU 21365]
MAAKSLAALFPHRHGRACPGHPRLFRAETKTWMPGTRPRTCDSSARKRERERSSDLAISAMLCRASRAG